VACEASGMSEATNATHGKKFKPDSLSAEYWTNRKTVGRMTFDNRIPEVHSRYAEALRAFATAQPNSSLPKNRQEAQVQQR